MPAAGVAAKLPSPPDGARIAALAAAGLLTAPADVQASPGSGFAADGAAGAAAGFAAGEAADLLSPGAALAGLTEDAHAAGLSRLTDDELAGVIRAGRRLSSWASALELTAVGELMRRREQQEAAGDLRAAEHADAEIAALLTLTGRGAGRVLELAAALQRLPLTAHALTAGAIDLPRMAVIADETTGLDDDHAAAVEQHILVRAPEQTTSQVRAAARRAVHAADPRAARKRQEQAQREARVERWDEHAGTAALAGRDLPPAAVIAADHHISALARGLRDAGLAGTADQVRARVFLALLSGTAASSLLPSGEQEPDPAAGSSGTSANTVTTGTPATPGSTTMPDQLAVHGQPGMPAGADTAVERGMANSPARHGIPATPSAPSPAFPGTPGAPGAPFPVNPGTPGAPGASSPVNPGTPGAPGAPSPVFPGTTGTPGTGPSPTSAWRPGIAAATGWPGIPAVAGNVNLTMPLSTWLGLLDTPGDVAGFGPLPADDSRALGAAMAGHPRTRWCVTLIGEDGRPVAHGCGHPGHGPPSPLRGPAPSPRGRPSSRPGPAPAEPSPAQPPHGSGSPARGPAPPDHDVGAAAWLAGTAMKWFESTGCTHQRQSAAYRPPPTLQHLIRVRQQTCAFPGCRRPAAGCDLDHTTPFQHGGLTCECNLAPLCRPHHRCKQAGGWRLAQPEPGVLVWQTPSGRTYTITPTEYPV